jgi:hypothetical protein
VIFNLKENPVMHPFPKSLSGEQNQEDPLESLISELREGLEIYWHTAGKILSESGVRLVDPQDDYFSLEKNFFSALFLYSYFRVGIPRHRRVFYVAVNQCLRGMVTGCDNLLDDEYKKTLDTDLPLEARKFRSVLDIMVSDRVLFEILLDYCRSNGLSTDLLMEASRASLTALTRSGAQEASEEAGIDKRLSPEEVLTKIHHVKTGLLFLCPWAIPPIIEGDRNLAATPITKALYKIGMGCQIMDDMVDLVSDLKKSRHNYVASLIEHGEDKQASRWLRETSQGMPAQFFAEFPALFSTAHATSSNYLEDGLSGLFSSEHQLFVKPAVLFLSQRIGVDRIIEAVDGKR